MTKPIQQPPSYCAYASDACDQSFEGVTRAKGVVLYPSQPLQIAATIESAVAILNQRQPGVWVKWRDFKTSGQVIFCSICKRMRFGDVVVADVTTLNLNLMFEIGFALGLEVPLILIRDTSYEKDTRNFEELGMLDTIGHVDFKTADGLSTGILDAMPATTIPAPNVAPNLQMPLYVVKDPVAHEGQVILLSTLKKSPLRFRTYDPLEDPRLTFHQARKQVGSSLGVVGHFLATERRGSQVHNARTALVAGMAVATGKSVLLLQEGQARQPIDYLDLVVPYATPSQIPGKLNSTLRRVTIGLQDTTRVERPETYGLLEQLDLGDVSAENEIRQLRGYFVQTAQFNEARRGHARLVVGRKGAGKTAIFYAVRDSLPRTSSHLVLDMKPEGHQFTKLREAVLSRLSPGLQEHTVTAFWNYILLCEIAQRVLRTDHVWAQRDPDRYRKFETLRIVYEEHMPDDTGDLSERLLRQIDTLTERFEQAGQPTDSMELTRVLFLEDIPALNTAVTDYLTEKSEVWLLIDNLDKGWPPRGASSIDILILRTVLEATRKLQRQFADQDVDLHSLVFIRNDIYEHLVRETPDRDKDTPISLDWDDPAFFKEILRQRILSTTNLHGSFDQVWQAICDPVIGSQDSFGFIIERTLMRPRDLLKFIHRAIEFAVNRGHQQIGQDDLLSAEKAVSEDLLVSVNYELADVDRRFADVLYSFIECPSELSIASVRELLQGGGISEEDTDEATHLLVWFGFLGVQSTGAADAQYAYQVHYNMAKLLTVFKRPGSFVVIHPAFRSALECTLSLRGSFS